jgi:ribosomal-protein-alanine N-acetyltransferase
MAPHRPPRVSIRASKPSDAPFIRELGRAAFGEYSGRAEHGTVQMASEAPTLIAVQNGERVGFAIVQILEPTAHLAAIAVVETARGTGVGAALLHASEKLARDRGSRSLSLTTADSNLAALDLFLKHGFRRTLNQGGQYARGQKTVALAKRL